MVDSDTSSGEMTDNYNMYKFYQNDSSKLVCTALLNVQEDKVSKTIRFF